MAAPAPRKVPMRRRARVRPRPAPRTAAPSPPRRPTTPGRRTSGSLLLAALLHAVLLWALLPSAFDPQVLRKAATSVVSRIEVALDPSAAPNVVAVTVPGRELQMEWQLGPPRDGVAVATLRIRPQGLRPGRLAFSRLGDAAAQDARSRSAPANVSALPAADFELARPAIAIVEPLAMLSVEEREALAAEALAPPVQIEVADPAGAAHGRESPIPSHKPTPRPAPAEPVGAAVGREPSRSPTPRPAPQVLPEVAEETALPTVEFPSLPELEAPLELTPAPATRPEPPPAAPDRGPGEWTRDGATFFSRVTEHLFEANQRALASAVKAGPRVSVDVRFVIDRDGRVLEARVLESSGDPAVDRRAVRVITRASPFPRIADEIREPRLELTVPVEVYRQ